MSGRHSFRELTKDFTTARRMRIDDMKSELLAEMPLHELRRARELTQRESGGEVESETARRLQAGAAG